MQASDGNFYGTTSYGGVGYNRTSGGGDGTIFRITVPIFTKNPFNLSPAIAAIPYSASISNQARSLPGETLNFSKISGPSWLGVSLDGTVSGTPVDADIGTNSFIVSLAGEDGPIFIDPFHAGRRLTQADCVSLAQRAMGPGATFDQAWLAPTGAAMQSSGR